MAIFDHSRGKKESTQAPTPEEIKKLVDEAHRLFVLEQYDQAIEQAREAAKYGNAMAMHVLGASLLRNASTAAIAAEAERWLRAGAEAGFSPAMLELGIAYSQGHGIPKNLVAAAKLFEDAVKAGCSSAYYHLGCCYEFGEGVDRDILRAAELYRKGADAGDPAAQFSLGQCYMTGSGVEEDYGEASRLFKASADLGFESARECLAMLEQLQEPMADAKEIMEGKLADAERLMADRNYDTARHIVEECAEVGMPRAQTFMGDFYSKAIAGYPRDSAKALEWYRRGADGGDVDAMIGVASILEIKGGEAEISEAVCFYERAAGVGSTIAAYCLGRIYDNAKDDRRAFIWYMTAAEAGDALSQRIIASMFETGRGTDEDHELALEWYAKAAGGGDLAARKAVGRLKASDIDSVIETKEQETVVEDISPEQIVHLITLSNNYYDVGNYDEAVAIDRRLAAIGNPRGLNALGWDYYKGSGVPRDLAKAFGLFLRSAEAGEPRAMVNLACCYQVGDGGVKDTTEAVRWFRRAAESDWYDGFFNLGLCYILGMGVEPSVSKALKAFETAAGLGSSRAYGCIGYIYETEYNDLKKAFDYYYKGACLGVGDAAYYLARFLEEGKGCAPDRERAIYFYRLAVQNGVEKARRALERLDVHIRLSEEECGELVALSKELYDADPDFALEQALLPAAMYDPCAAEIVALRFTFGSFKNKLHAAKMFKIAARAGLDVSQNNLGWCYEKGLGVDVDPLEAVYWYRKGAENDNVHAMLCYAWCLTYGFGCNVNYTEAMDWYRQAGGKGDARAFYNLGLMYERGQGTHVDYGEARLAYRKAADMGYDGALQAMAGIEGRVNPAIGSDEALAHEADNFYSVGRYDEAFAKARRPADNGNPLAAQILALCYEFGFGTTEDMVQAVRYYKVAVEAGYISSLLNLGVAYQYGKGGLAIDLKRAAELFRKAAEKGDRVAQCNLGYCYEQGEGVEMDMTQAAYWYRMSADQDWSRAQAYLGVCYENAWGVEEDDNLAFELYLKSAISGYAYGQLRLARCYDFSIGVDRDVEEAVRWYTKAAAGGSEFAKKRLLELK